MAEYEQSMAIAAEPEAIFDFVSDIANLPKYLPTTKQAQGQGENRVRVQGEANGRAYDSDGYLRPDRSALRMTWGADEGYYSGWLAIQAEDEGAVVTVHISLRGQMDSEDGPPQAQIQEGLASALLSIQNFVEGGGGKVQPSAETS